MSKKLMAVFLMLVLAASPALASVQNVKVGGDLKVTSVMRRNMGDFHGSTASPFQKFNREAFISQLGLTIQADLTDNVTTDFRFVNERVWGEEDGRDSDLGLFVDTASITLKELFYSPMTVVIGRQPLVYGNSFLIGSSGVGGIDGIGTITGQDNFDAIKVVLDYNPLTVDLFAAKVNEGDFPTAVGGALKTGDTNLYGINANYQLGDKMNTVVEGYIFAKLNKFDTGVNKRYTPGIRVSTNPIEGLNLQGEFAYQIGKYSAVSNSNLDSVRAFATQFMANYALPVMKDMKPVLSASYTLYSGEKYTTGRTGAFDSLYADQFTGRIFADTIGDAYPNLQIIHLGFEVTPIQDVTAKLSWYNLKQHKTDPANPFPSRQNAKIGNEFDLDICYAYTEDVTFGVSAGLMLPTSSKYNYDDKTATQLLSSVKVVF